MPSYDEVKSVLDKALELEKAAEDNCAKLLAEFKLNGFEEIVRHIENDEIRHQEMVKKLLDFLG